MMLCRVFQNSFQVQVQLRNLLTPTIKELSEYVQKTDEKIYLPTIERVERKKYYPSFISHQRSTKKEWWLKPKTFI
ncbi:hypothetical protein K4A85_05655 [Bacillus pumilus]|nr:hypothetical protein K4A85_05655 [Bacillus pumilus]